MTDTLPYEIDVPQRLIDDIRMYYGDQPEFNRLIEGTEVSDEKIKLAIRLWTQHFNSIPPKLVTVYDFTNFPNYLILFHGVIIEILKMSGIIQSRNFLNFNDGGASFTVNDKAQDYLQWINTLVSTHQRDVENLKVALNSEEGYYHIDSPEAYWFYGVDDY